MIPSDWEVLSIKQCSSICAGGTPSTLVDEYWGGSIPWMNSGEIHLKKIKDVSGRITIKGLNNSSTKLLPKYCVLIALAGQGKTRGTVGINMVELCTNQSVAAIMPSTLFNSMFLYYYLDNQYKQLRQLSDGDGGRGGLTKGLLENLMVPIPFKKEQEKIANALTRIDNLIEDYEKLIKKKEKIKQGLMQNLITGKVRLKGFDTIYKTDSLGNICEIKKGKQINGNVLLNKGKYYMLNGGQEPSGYLNQYNTLENTISISEGGNSCGYVNYNKEKFWAGGHLYIVDRFKTKMDTLYFYYLLKHNESSIMQLRKGSGLPNIQKSDLMSFEIYLTDDIKEQVAISQILSNADNEINDLKIKLNKIIDIKKGMLDNLLTGRIRL